MDMDLLKDLFKDQGSPSQKQFKKYLAKNGYEITNKELTSFIKDQESFQLFKRRKIKKSTFFPIYGEIGSFQCDTTLFPNIFAKSNGDSKGFINLININTRFMYCLEIKRDVATADEVIMLLNKVKGIKNISTDRGSEFLNKTFKNCF